VSNYSDLNLLISEFSGQQSIIGCHRIYCKFMDGLEGGVFLSQIIYYSDKGKRRDGWFYKTYEEWEDELQLSAYKIKKFADQLVAMGILETTIMKANGAPTVHYRFDFQKFTNRILEYLRMESEKASESITETTQRIPETTSPDGESFPGDSEWPTESNFEARDELPGPEQELPDPIASILKHSKKKKRSWTVPAAAGGADPYRDDPLTAACAVLRISPEVLTENEQRQYALVIREITEGVKTGTPELFTKACRAWATNGPTWKGKTCAPYSNIRSDGFRDDMQTLMRQILSDTLTTPDSWSKAI